MPTSKDLKRLTRRRMVKTGESYTAARARLLAKKSPSPDAAPSPAELAGMSDAAVRKATGRSWPEWARALDAVGAAAWTHRDIAAHLRIERELSAWWAQTVAVGYERIRGLRDKGQRRGGAYEVNKSRTVAVPLGTLYRAFATKRIRERWLGDAEIEVRTCRVNRSVRWRWPDGTPVEATFAAKGDAKSQVQLQHRGLPTKVVADRVRARWAERLDALVREVKPRR